MPMQSRNRRAIGMATLSPWLLTDHNFNWPNPDYQQKSWSEPENLIPIFLELLNHSLVETRGEAVEAELKDPTTHEMGE